MTPFKGRNRVTSPYGWRTLNGVRQWHAGQDIVGDDDWNVRAIWSGRAEVSIGVNYGRGNMVTLYYSDTLRVISQHLSDVYVKSGDFVNQGQIIGFMGNTPGAPYSYGAHLHIEVQVLSGGKWVAVEPSQYTEVPNVYGTHAGNDNVDGTPSEEPLKPTASTVVLQVGAMSDGDMGTFMALTESLALGRDQKGNMLYCGPMTAGDQKTIASKAGDLRIPCEEFKGEVTLAIGAMSEGDLRTMTAKAKELSLDYSTADYRENEWMLYAPVSYGDRLEMEKLAYSLLLPVGLA